jgi:hypothetical protein
MVKNQARREQNQRTACRMDNPRSLIRSRTFAAGAFYHSESCPYPGTPVLPEGCNCDEYPMASTWQGAPTPEDSNASRVSAKVIDRRQNSSAGGALRGFYARERVLDLTDYATTPIRAVGDNFWVNARDLVPVARK